MKITIDRFGGIAPRFDPTKLPLYGAQVAEDVRLLAGTVSGYLRPFALENSPAIPNDTKTIFYDTGGENWFVWGTDVHVAAGPVADANAARRYYYTGDGVPKKTDAAMAASGSGDMPRTWLKMGVPAPATAPTLTSDNAGTGLEEDHVYVITYVSTFSGIKEESAPSPPVTFSGWQPGDTITITRTDTAPTSGYNITHWRVYRSNGYDYRFVKEVGIGSMSTTDALLNDKLGEAISTLEFDPPPDDLRFLVALPNGSLAGISGNELCFSEPYQPHAWPPRYRKTVPDIPVALAAIGQSIYVATEGRPALCTGVEPSGMSLELAATYAPCISPASMVTDGQGALYATYNGIAYVQGNEVMVASAEGLTRDEWALYNPPSMRGIYHDGRYFLWYTLPDGAKGGLIFDKNVPDAPISTSREYTDAAHIVAATGALCIAQEGEIRQVNTDQINPRTPFRWRSRVFQLPLMANFGFARVQIDDSVPGSTGYEAKVAFNQGIINAGTWPAAFGDDPFNTWSVNGSEMLTDILGSADYLVFRVFADGELVAERGVLSSTTFRLPSGFKAKNWEF